MTGDRALVFWFYRDIPVCRNRLEILRRENPGVSIFGLFGGDPGDAPRFRDALAPLLDDFWAYDRSVPSKWKWRHGDLLLAAWYEARGQHLAWSHVFVAQWDMLLLAPIERLVPELEPDDVLLSGVRPVAAIESSWVWTQGGHRPEYQAFTEAIAAHFGPVEPLSCLFVIACIPRRLLAAYAELEQPEVGYIEYRLPTLASAIGLRVVDDGRFPTLRKSDTAATASRRQRFLSGSRRPIHLPTVVLELTRTNGARVFHPYHGLFPSTPGWALRAPVWAMFVAARTARGAVTARVRRVRRRRNRPFQPR